MHEKSGTGIPFCSSDGCSDIMLEVCTLAYQLTAVEINFSPASVYMSESSRSTVVLVNIRQVYHQITSSVGQLVSAHPAPLFFPTPLGLLVRSSAQKVNQEHSCVRR